jgi:hypothetical protein
LLQRTSAEYLKAAEPQAIYTKAQAKELLTKHATCWPVAHHMTINSHLRANRLRQACRRALWLIRHHHMPDAFTVYGVTFVRSETLKDFSRA